MQKRIQKSTGIPFLILNVDRNNIVQETFNQLTRVAKEDLKKPLKVFFKNEEALDDGGVTKELFQLITREVFKVEYGLFSFNREMGVYWFNPNSLEGSIQYELIGITLALGIYNKVILGIKFPSILYKKLLGRKHVIEDVRDINPQLYEGFKQLLEVTTFFF